MSFSNFGKFLSIIILNFPTSPFFLLSATGDILILLIKNIYIFHFFESLDCVLGNFSGSIFSLKNFSLCLIGDEAVLCKYSNHGLLCGAFLCILSGLLACVQALQCREEP